MYTGSCYKPPQTQEQELDSFIPLNDTESPGAIPNQQKKVGDSYLQNLDRSVPDRSAEPLHNTNERLNSDSHYNDVTGVS